MAILDLAILPDPILKTVSEPVEEVTPEICALLDDMAETMYDAPGIGLAAVQVARPLRLVVADVSRDEEVRDPTFFINPEIIWSSEDKVENEEGCLSIPDVFDMVTRPSEVTVRYMDREGKFHEMLCEGLLATCLQHEIDHLNGVLFIDHLSRLKRERVVKKFTKAAKLAKDVA